MTVIKKMQKIWKRTLRLRTLAWRANVNEPIKEDPTQKLATHLEVRALLRAEVEKSTFHFSGTVLAELVVDKHVHALEVGHGIA